MLIPQELRLSPKVIVGGSDTILSLYNKAFVEVMVLLNLDYMDIKR